MPVCRLVSPAAGGRDLGGSDIGRSDLGGWGLDVAGSPETSLPVFFEHGLGAGEDMINNEVTFVIDTFPLVLIENKGLRAERLPVP
jgi:hypothetical protein